jgi:hypothetical protein
MLTLFVSLIIILIIFSLLFKYAFKYKSGFLLFYIKYILIFNTSAYVHALEDLLGLFLTTASALTPFFPPCYKLLSCSACARCPITRIIRLLTA